MNRRRIPESTRALRLPLAATRLRLKAMRPALLLLAALLALHAGCVRRETITVEVTPDRLDAAADIRSATNLPEQFSVVTPAATQGDCPPLLRDIGLQATLRLRRSVLRQVPDTARVAYRAVGDYAVEPQGSYGEKAGEGLRIICAELRALGVVQL